MVASTPRLRNRPRSHPASLISTAQASSVVSRPVRHWTRRCSASVALHRHSTRGPRNAPENSHPRSDVPPPVGAHGNGAPLQRLQRCTGQSRNSPPKQSASHQLQSRSRSLLSDAPNTPTQSVAASQLRDGSESNAVAVPSASPQLPHATPLPINPFGSTLSSGAQTPQGERHEGTGPG